MELPMPMPAAVCGAPRTPRLLGLGAGCAVRAPKVSNPCIMTEPGLRLCDVCAHGAQYKVQLARAYGLAAVYVHGVECEAKVAELVVAPGLTQTMTLS